MTAGEGWSGFMHNRDPADTPQPDCCTDMGVGWGGGGSSPCQYCTPAGTLTNSGGGSFLGVLCSETIHCDNTASSNGEGQLDSHTGVDLAPFTHTPEEKLQAGCV